MKPKTFVCVKDLHKEFKMGATVVRALDGVSLEIKRASFTVIMGPSGSGKSTLLYLIGGLDWPTSGSILVDGEEIQKLDENSLAVFQRRRKVGFIFQSFNLIAQHAAEEKRFLSAAFFRGDPPLNASPAHRPLLDRSGWQTA
jgi:putative ABC transport system ATP-binding protein